MIFVYKVDFRVFCVKGKARSALSKIVSLREYPYFILAAFTLVMRYADRTKFLFNIN